MPRAILYPHIVQRAKAEREAAMPDPVTGQQDREEPRCRTCGGIEVGTGGCSCLTVLDLYRSAMRRELEGNAKKGGREGPGGWIEGMTPERRISELLYHCAKLAYAQRQHLQGEGDPLKVVEFGADVGNCALMILDGLSLLPPVGARVLPQQGEPDARFIAEHLAASFDVDDLDANPQGADWLSRVEAALRAARENRKEPGCE